MTEMGIQMELKRRDSGLMHRAITRKPRVNIKSKPRKYSSRSSEGMTRRHIFVVVGI